jgi:hypothetical protein
MKNMLKRLINIIWLYVKEKLSLSDKKNNMKYKDFDKEDKKYLRTSIFIDIILVTVLVFIAFLIFEFLLTL